MAISCQNIQYVHIFVIFSIRANAENNDIEFQNQTNRTGTIEDFKADFSCNSEDEKIRQSQRRRTYVQNVCLSSDYQINEPPSILSEIAVTFVEQRILDVDERKKRITMLINLMVFWEDYRIKTKLPIPKEGIVLPPFEMTKREIWFPLANIWISSMSFL